VDQVGYQPRDQCIGKSFEERPIANYEERRTYSADDIIMIRKVSLALSTTVNAIRIQIDVVLESHIDCFVDRAESEGIS